MARAKNACVRSFASSLDKLNRKRRNLYKGFQYASTIFSNACRRASGSELPLAMIADRRVAGNLEERPPIRVSSIMFRREYYERSNTHTDPHRNESPRGGKAKPTHRHADGRNCS